MADREREVIVIALTEYCSSTGQDLRAFELRDGIREGLILHFKLCKPSENYTRCLVLLFDSTQDGKDPDWIDFDDCVMRTKNAICEFWDGTCKESKYEAPIRFGFILCPAPQTAR